MADNAAMRIRSRRPGEHIDADDFAGLCSYLHQRSGMEAVIGHAELIRDGEVMVEGEIRADGRVVGEFQRWCWPEGADRSQLVAKPSLLKIDEEYQGRGFGRAFHLAFEDRCRQAGINRIEILAQEVGAYSWAHSGYHLYSTDYPPFLLVSGDSRENALDLEGLFRAQAGKIITRLVSRREELIQELIAEGKVSRQTADELYAQLLAEDAPVGYLSSDQQAIRSGQLEGKIDDLMTLADFGRAQKWQDERGHTWLGREILLNNEWRGYKFLQTGIVSETTAMPASRSSVKRSSQL